LRDLVARDLKVRYKRSALGILWTMLNPLLLMLIFSIVFARPAWRAGRTRRGAPGGRRWRSPRVRAARVRAAARAPGAWTQGTAALDRRTGDAGEGERRLGEGIGGELDDEVAIGVRWTCEALGLDAGVLARAVRHLK
jgi:hypothetical protein